MCNGTRDRLGATPDPSGQFQSVSGCRNSASPLAPEQSPSPAAKTARLLRWESPNNTLRSLFDVIYSLSWGQLQRLPRGRTATRNATTTAHRPQSSEHEAPNVRALNVSVPGAEQAGARLSRGHLPPVLGGNPQRLRSNRTVTRSAATTAHRPHSSEHEAPNVRALNVSVTGVRQASSCLS